MLHCLGVCDSPVQLDIFSCLLGRKTSGPKLVRSCRAQVGQVRIPPPMDEKKEEEIKFVVIGNKRPFSDRKRWFDVSAHFAPLFSRHCHGEPQKVVLVCSAARKLQTEAPKRRNLCKTPANFCPPAGRQTCPKRHSRARVVHTLDRNKSLRLNSIDERGKRERKKSGKREK